MVRRYAIAAWIGLGALSAAAQISGPYPGGGYPPGTYPPGTYPPGQRSPGSTGPSWPGRGRKGKQTSTSENQPVTTSVEGRLRQINATDLVVETDDKRTVSISTGEKAKFLTSAGDAAGWKDFEPGDRVNVDSTQDEHGYFHAVRVKLEKKGTAADRASASQPADVSPTANSGVADPEDRPHLKRKPLPGETAPSVSPQAPSPAKTADAAPPAEAEGAAPNSPPTTVTPAPAPADPDDPGRPILRRGIPKHDDRQIRAAVQPPGDREIPSVVRKSPRSEPMPSDPIPVEPATGGSVRGPKPEFRSGGDPIIEKAREAAFTFTETLPNYTVKQFTTRFYSQSSHGNSTSWQPQDNISADVLYENGKESYKNVLLNGRPPKDKIEKTGSWSTGEFATVLRDVLSTSTDADFHNRRSSTIVNRAAYRYDFAVDQGNSHWHIYAASQSYSPAYKGAIWIDKENSRVLRIEMSAKAMPADFPFDAVESATDYDYVLIGGPKFVLPVHSENLSCSRGTNQCSKNIIDFRNYRKYGSDTEITFDNPESGPAPKAPPKKK